MGEILMKFVVNLPINAYHLEDILILFIFQFVINLKKFWATGDNVQGLFPGSMLKTPPGEQGVPHVMLEIELRLVTCKAQYYFFGTTIIYSTQLISRSSCRSKKLAYPLWTTEHE